jgi:hypothetical protein
MEGTMTRRELCAVCGGTIAAPDGDWPAIAAAVRAHYASARHETDPRVARERAARRRAERRVMALELALVRARRSVAVSG